jgi:hypothetical protein
MLYSILGGLRGGNYHFVILAPVFLRFDKMIVLPLLNSLRIGCIAPRDEPLENIAEKRGLREWVLPAYMNDYKAQKRSFCPFKVEWRFGAVLALNFVILMVVNAHLRLVDKISEAFRKIIWMMSGHHLEHPQNHQGDVRTSSR